MHNPLDIRVSIKDDKGEVLMCYMLQVCYDRKVSLWFVQFHCFLKQDYFL